MPIYSRAGDVIATTLLDDEDFWRRPEVPLRMRPDGYAAFCVGRAVNCIMLHRWVMGCVRGDGLIVDHRNRNKLDNRRENLRFVTASESCINRDMPHNGGTPRASGKFQVSVQRNRQKFYIGHWRTPEEVEAAREWFLSGPLTEERAALARAKSKTGDSL